MGLTERTRLEGRLAATEASVLGILDEEAQSAERAALKLTKAAIRGASPVGPGRHNHHLRDAFRYSVRRSPYGYAGTMLRDGWAWYGRIVEGGRKAGVSRNGRRYPGARANPFVDRTMATVASEAEALLAAGAVRAGERIGAVVRVV